MIKEFVSSNGGILAVLAVCFALGAGYLEWRIAVNVNQAFTDAGTIAPHRMDAAEEDIDKLESVDEKLDTKIERIVQILLEE